MRKIIKHNNLLVKSSSNVGKNRNIQMFFVSMQKTSQVILVVRKNSLSRRIEEK
jgi:hypothetical protein